MSKQIKAACLALVVVALFPAAALASPHLTDEKKAIAVGASLKFTNEEAIEFLSEFGNFICATSTMQGKVVANTGKSIQVEIESFSATGHEAEGQCSGLLGKFKLTAKNLPWCLRMGGELAADTLEITGGKCSGEPLSVTVIADAEGGECKYSKASLAGTFNTGSVPATLKVANQTMTREEGSGIFCPPSVKLTARYLTETGTSPFNSVLID
ncbi:MAG TPA: hypothetical protein VFN92_11390 [Solirubrobacterales bacterium]|nr:hypothetical protein [Solirubrobacterales bacterium]